MSKLTVEEWRALDMLRFGVKQALPDSEIQNYREFIREVKTDLGLDDMEFEVRYMQPLRAVLHPAESEWTPGKAFLMEKDGEEEP